MTNYQGKPSTEKKRRSYGYFLYGGEGAQLHSERPVGLYWISTTTKINQISTKYRPHSIISTKILTNNFFLMHVIATLHISRPKSACSFWQDYFLSYFSFSLFLIQYTFKFRDISYHHSERFLVKISTI